MRWGQIFGITVIGFVIFLIFLFNLIFGFNLIWDQRDCGGIDPGGRIGCSKESYGYKKTCLLLYICWKEKSQMKMLNL